jgi:hypothetical protein
MEMGEVEVSQKAVVTHPLPQGILPPALPSRFCYSGGQRWDVLMPWKRLGGGKVV